MIGRANNGAIQFFQEASSAKEEAEAISLRTSR